jgi:hypothetical protein
MSVTLTEINVDADMVGTKSREQFHLREMSLQIFTTRVSRAGLL